MSAFDAHRAARRLGGVLLASTLVAGCSVFKPPPQELDLRGAEVAAMPPHTIGVANGNGSRNAIGRGATMGAGLGAAAIPFGTPLCAAAGPAVGFCLMALVPIGGALGAGTGAVADKVNGEPRESVQARRSMVVAEVTAADSENLLAAQVRKSLQSRHGIATSEGGGSATGSPWKVEVAVKSVAMYGALDDPDFTLRVRGKLALKRTSDNRIVYRADLLAFSDDQVVPVTPDADPNELIRSRLERGIQLVSEKLAANLLSRTQTTPEANDGDDDESAEPPATPAVALSAN
jgi:hypothetical protein